MRAWLRHHGVSLVQTLERLARSPVSTTLNVLAIGAALALPVGAYCLLLNLETLSRHISVEPQLSVFLAGNAGPADITSLASELKQTHGVQSVRFVSRDEALADLKRGAGMEEVIATLRHNPLPDAFVVTLSGRDPAIADGIERQFKSLPKVAHVQADSVWVRRLDALLRLGRTSVMLLSALLCLALVAVTFNTIRLQILTQQDEIELCALIGATRAYICRPFFYLGSVLGLLGGLAALFVVLGALAVLDRDWAQLGALYGIELGLRFPELRELAAILGICVALGWLGAYWSVSRYLRVFERR